MKKALGFGLLSALLIGTTALPSDAQSFYNNFNGGWGGGYGNMYGRNRTGVHQQRINAFNARMAQARAEINMRLSRGRLSPAMAARLNARLDQLSVQFNAAVTSGGRLNFNELARLEARLDNIRVAARSGGRGWF